MLNSKYSGEIITSHQLVTIPYSEFLEEIQVTLFPYMLSTINDNVRAGCLYMGKWMSQCWQVVGGQNSHSKANTPPPSPLVCSSTSLNCSSHPYKSSITLKYLLNIFNHCISP